MSLQSWPGTECSARVGEMMMKTTLSAVLLGLGLAFSVPSFAAVNINTADQKALETLPGVGPAKAQAIIAHRPYKSKADLKKRSEEHTPELQSIMRISYAAFFLKKKKNK